MPILCNSFVKFNGKKFDSHKMKVFYQNRGLNEMCYKGTALYKDDVPKSYKHPLFITTISLV